MNEPAAVLRQRRDMGSRAPSGAPSWRDKLRPELSARSVHEELDRTTHIPNDHKMSHQPRRLAAATAAHLRVGRRAAVTAGVARLSDSGLRPVQLDLPSRHAPIQPVLRQPPAAGAAHDARVAVPVLSHSRTNGVMWQPPKRHCNASEPTAAGRPLRRQGDAFAMLGGNGGPGKGAALAWVYSHAAIGHREATAAAVELP